MCHIAGGIVLGFFAWKFLAWMFGLIGELIQAQEYLNKANAAGRPVLPRGVTESEAITDKFEIPATEQL